MSDIHSILFVCTGNTCRSAMAQGLLEKRLAEIGRDGIEARSAGILAADGLPPTDETLTVMKDLGIDLSDFKSRGLTDDMIKNSDLILVMEPLHRVEVLRRAPEAASKTYLLKDFGIDEKTSEHSGVSVPDPLGKSMSVYRQCFDIIKNQIERIAQVL